jgi:hypothetical protein
MPEFSIAVSAGVEALRWLAGRRGRLVALKGVRVAARGGMPVVWLTAQPAMRMTLVWDACAVPYVSATPLVRGSVVEPCFEIPNETMRTRGLAQEVNGELNPICAQPIRTNRHDVVIPVEQVLLVFATQMLSAGSLVTRISAPGLLVDASAGHREVAFDLEEGWSCGGYAWGTPVAADRNLVPLLLDDGAVTYVEQSLGT